MSSKTYCGVGSRLTPSWILTEMQRCARELAVRGFTLRSGAAPGADTAFELGCDQGFGSKEIYLPWYKFNGSLSRLYVLPQVAYDTAAQVHPGWSRLSKAAQKLHARNVQQVLGRDCDDPVELVLCWTRGGLPVGGTATVLLLAAELDVPVINFALDGYKEQLKERLGL